MTERDLRLMLRQELNHALGPIISKLKADAAYTKKRFLTINETAEYLSIGKSTVHYWVKIGKLKKHYIKGSPRFDKEEIDNELKNN